MPEKKNMWQPRQPAKCTCGSSIFDRLADPESMEYLHSSMVTLQAVTSKNEVHVDAYECQACGRVEWVSRQRVELT